MTAAPKAAPRAPASQGRDLGVIDGPLFCFGGAYSNAQATKAVLAEARTRGFGPERILCTGDVVAYCGDPEATVELIRAAGIHVVMGNCEESVGFAAADCNCGFEDGSDCAEWSKSWFAHAASVLDADAKAWMRGLPRQLRLEISGRRFAVIHGGDENISEYVFASTAVAAKARIFDRLAQAGPVDGVIAGHAGLPFTQIIGHRIWHNAGAIGMPANDGTPRGWFSIIAPEAGGMGISLHPLNYDHDGAARAAAAITPDLPYAQTLGDGLWPNMAVLPRAERRLRGRPLSFEPVYWADAGNAAAE